MSSLSNPQDGVVIAAPVSFGYARTSDQGTAWFIGGVFRELLQAAGLVPGDIDGLAVSSLTLPPAMVASLGPYFDLKARWLEHLPFGGASGVLALRRAARAVQAGDAEIVACIGADTSRSRKRRDVSVRSGKPASDPDLSRVGAGAHAPAASITRAYMERHGAAREDFGRICLAQHHNARHNPLALFAPRRLDMNGYIAARAIAEPLHLYDCARPCAGGEGFLVLRESRARALGLPFARMLATAERHNALTADPVQLRACWECFATELYDAAGITPGEIDLLQTSDDYPVFCLLQMEGLEFCAPGEGPLFLRETPLTFDGGGLPHNTSGGQLWAGRAGAAGGFIGLVEALRQLTDAAHGRQVPGASYALVSSFGMNEHDRALCSAAAVLERQDAD